ncbi:hypothetical protein ZHAS_00019914 [Anopheles sinensis]|uniref:Uncharacterized protein n=1 Tax=Anopheles sinensis TaxID=74873 RepID=A0A084WMJ0_ANOSI|nr:hypothetical protein ZHAS_00019914 [Anopheles sinensis]
MKPPGEGWIEFILVLYTVYAEGYDNDEVAIPSTPTRASPTLHQVLPPKSK